MISYFQMKFMAQVYPSKWHLVAKPKMISYFQMKCSCSDIWWPRKGHLRQHIQRRMSSNFQMKCSCSGQEQGTFRWHVQDKSHLLVYRVTFKFTPSKWHLVAKDSIIFRWSVHAVVKSRAPSDDVYRSRVTFKFTPH